MAAAQDEATDLNARGIPFGFVFTEIVKELKEPWTVTFSHEALELVGDPEANRLGADGIPLASFGINEGGYVGFFNPKSRKHETFALEGDTEAKKRLRIKSKANLTRRSMRYKSGVYYQERVDTTIRVPDDRRRTRRGQVRAAASKPTRPVEMIDSANERPSDS